MGIDFFSQLKLSSDHVSSFLYLFVCLFVSYLFRVGHSTDMFSLLQENLLGGKKESVSRSYVHGRRGIVMTRSAARGPQKKMHAGCSAGWRKREKKNARGLQRWLELFFSCQRCSPRAFFFCGPRAAERVISRPRRP